MSKTRIEPDGRAGRHRQDLGRATPMTVRVTNTSGTEGVSGSWSKKGYFRYSATLRMPDGTILSKSFSIIKYGQEQALALAIAARHEMASTVG